MIKIEGSVCGVFRDINTGEITREFEEVHNHIQNSFLKTFYRHGSTTPALGAYLFASSYNPGKQTRHLPSTINTNYSVRGVDIDGVPRTELKYEDSPGVHLIQKVQRMNPPISDFTINSVGLCASINNSYDVLGLTNIVWLESPCVQTPTETLDLFYRVQVKYSPDYLTLSQYSKNITPNEAWTVTRALADLSDIYLIYSTHWGTHIPCDVLQLSKVNSRHLSKIRQKTSAYEPYTVTLTDRAYTNKPEFYKIGVLGNNRLENNIGTIITHLSNGDDMLCFKITDANSNPVQSVFGHRTESTTPFYSATTAQLGLGGIDVNGDSWTDPDHPKYFKVDVTTSGLEGVGEYKFRMCNQYSFDGNNFKSNYVDLPWSFEENEHIHNGFNINSKYKYTTYFEDNVILIIDVDEISKVDILTGNSTVIDNTTLIGTDLSPRFHATSVCQVETNNTLDIFIACRATGLYKLNKDFDNLTIINSGNTGLENTSGCYGVHVGKNGRVWAFFTHTTQNTLYYSDDNGVTWSNSGMVDTDFDTKYENILSIHSDPNNHHVAIHYFDVTKDISVGTGTKYIKWWNQDTTTLSQGPAIGNMSYTTNGVSVVYRVGVVLGYQGHVSCSPTSSVWVSGFYNHYTLTFGTTALDTTTLGVLNIRGSSMYTNWYTDKNGNDVLRYISQTSNGGTDTSSGYYSIIYNPLNNYFEAVKLKANNVYTALQCFIVDGQGLWLNRQYIDESFTYQLLAVVPHAEDTTTYQLHYDFAYPEYGWNGTSWEKHHASGKPIHSAYEELIDGITISFNDNAGTTPFLDSDHYTFGVVDGLWIDGFTTFDSYWEAYSKPTILNTETEYTVLQNVQKVSNRLRETIPAVIEDFIDTESTTVTGEGLLMSTGTGLLGDYNAGARSTNPVIIGGLSPFIPFGVIVPDTDIYNAQGYVEFTPNIQNGASSRIEYYAGLSTPDRLSTLNDFNTINYAIHIDNQSVEALADGRYLYATLRIVENSIERYIHPELVYWAGSPKIRIILLNNGSIIYMFKSNADVSWTTLYQTPIGSVPLVDYHFDVNYVPVSGYGIKDLSYHSLTTDDNDYYMYLGNGTDQGIYNPEFVAIDPDSVKVFIDGTEAIMIGRDDAYTALPANSYSVYPYAGVIRYSAADIGKTITAEYVTLVDE